MQVYAYFLFLFRIDMYYEGARDFIGAFLAICFSDPKNVLDKAKTEALPRYLPVFDQVRISLITCLPFYSW